MLTLRLARAGTKKRPVYHLVAADRRARRDGKFVENLGYYVPARKILVLKHERVDYWLSVGAHTSDTARQLIKKAKKEGNTEPKAKPDYVPPPPPKVEAKPAPKKEEAKADAPKADAEAPKTEEAKAEAPKAEEAKADAPKADKS